MYDFALVWNPATGQADMQMAGPQLLADQSLHTAVIISLFSDAPAQPGDEIPDGTADRRGWWGDMPVDPAAQDAAMPDVTGSRLWLLERALQTQQTLNRAEQYARDALAWMLADGVAGAVTATASYPQLGWIQLAITIVQEGSSSVFNFPWSLS